MAKLLVFASTFPRWENDVNPPFVYELSKRLKEFDVTVLAPDYPGSESYQVMDNMRVFRFRYFLKKYETLAGSGGILPTLRKNKFYYLLVPFFILGEFFSLRKQVKKDRPDIVHAHWILSQGFIAAIIKKIYGVPFVVTTHGGDIFGLRGRFFTALKRFTLRNADRITVVSNAIKDEIINKIDTNLQIQVMSMGVDSKLFNPEKQDDSIRKKYGIEGPFLLFVGRLAEKKGVKYLLHAMKNVVVVFPGVKLMIIGTGPLENELKAISQKLGLAENIIFTGAIQNKLLPVYYATADIFVGPSVEARGGNTEGFGLTFVEAGFSGCALVGSDVGGISDIIKNNETGFLVRQKDPEDISRAILTLLNNEEVMAKIRSNVRSALIANYDWEVIAGKYGKILKLI